MIKFNINSDRVRVKHFEFRYGYEAGWNKKGNRPQLYASKEKSSLEIIISVPLEDVQDEIIDSDIKYFDFIKGNSTLSGELLVAWDESNGTIR